MSWSAPLFLLLFFLNNTLLPCTEQMDFQVHITLPVTLDRHGYDTAAASHAHGTAPQFTGPTCAGSSLKTALTLSWPTSHRQLDGALRAWGALALRTPVVLHPTCHRQVGVITPQPGCGQTATWRKVWGLACQLFQGHGSDKVSKIVPHRETCIVGAAVREGVCCCQNNAIN